MCQRKRPGDRQAQAKTFRSPSERVLTLLERLENPRKELPPDADAGVATLDNQWLGARAGIRPIARADADRPARGREFHGVLDQVPDHLLESGWVGLSVVGRGRQVEN